MHFVICVTLVLVTMAAGAPLDSDSPNPKPQYNIEDAPALFEKYIKDFNKEYKDEADKQIHYKEFVKSLGVINRLNSDPNQSAHFDINHFADLTDEERSRSRGFIRT